jgi:translation initiation factor IF-2
VRTELLQHEIVVEAMGGDTIDVEVSAKAGTNLDKLLEMPSCCRPKFSTCKANPNRTAEGLVIEAQLDKGRGPWPPFWCRRARCAWATSCRRRRMGPRPRPRQRQGRPVKEAGPSKPVEVLGLPGHAGSR